jgi:hypothetical protein
MRAQLRKVSGSCDSSNSSSCAATAAGASEHHGIPVQKTKEVAPVLGVAGEFT